MTKTINNTLGARLAAALDLQARATPYIPEENPLAHKEVPELAGTAGVPVLNMAAKTNGAGMAQALEESVFTTRQTQRDATVAKRVAQHRARAAKKVEFDRIAALDVTPDPERMTQAWRVVFPLVPIVTAIANEKKRWAARYLGSVVDDVAQVVLERMALVLAKSDKDLLFLMRAADELGAVHKDTNRIPANQLTDDERAERKAMGKARKWLMGMVNNRVQGTLVDLYTESRNLRWDNIDIITTVMASINGVGGDPLLGAHKASRAPGFLGTRFQRPDGIDQGLVAQAINAAITERGLDLMVEILLNEENRENGGSGAVRWTKVAERLFLATPTEIANGRVMWDAVCKATESHARPKRARADAARMHVRNLFEWLPGFIVQVVESFDPQFRYWSNGKAVLASDFEWYYLPDEPEVRTPFVPKLVYATVEEAAAALTRHIDVLTGADLVGSIANA